MNKTILSTLGKERTMSHVYRLAYKDTDELIAEVGPAKFRRGSRISVKVSEGSDYIFTFSTSRGDHLIYGLSAAREGVGVTVDLNAMTLTEH